MAIVIPLASDSEEEVLAFPGAKPVKVVMGDEELVANPPPAGLLMLVYAAQSDAADPSDQISSVFELLQHVFDEDDYRVFRSYIAEGKIGVDAIVALVSDLVEQWSDLPTDEPSGSSPSPKSTGPKSTAKRRSTART